MTVDWERVLAGVGLVWIVGCWAVAVYCLVVGEIGLFFGMVFASLFLPLLLNAFEAER